MSDLDRIAEMVADHQALSASGHEPRMTCRCGWKGYRHSEHVANTLIAAGCRMDEPICGATTKHDGCDLVCELPPGHVMSPGHCAEFGIHWWGDHECLLGNVFAAAKNRQNLSDSSGFIDGCGKQMSEPGGAGNTNQALTQPSADTEQEG